MVHRRVRGGEYKINYVKNEPPVALGEELVVNIIMFVRMATEGQGFGAML